MTLLLLAAIAILLLLIADATLGRPDRLGCHATVGDHLAARLAPGRVLATVAVAAAIPLFGLAQLAKLAAQAASPHIAAALAA
jgi:hypothetical protein